eukprot:2495516-Rhodomonas_salina.1
MASRVSYALDPHACCAMSIGTENDICRSARPQSPPPPPVSPVTCFAPPAVEHASTTLYLPHPPLPPPFSNKMPPAPTPSFRASLVHTFYPTAGRKVATLRIRDELDDDLSVFQRLVWSQSELQKLRLLSCKVQDIH